MTITFTEKITIIITIRDNNNFNTAYSCSRLIIAINTAGITKYKPSVIYKKTKKPLFNFHVPLHLFHYAKL